MGYRVKKETECPMCKQTIRKNELQYDTPAGLVCKTCYEENIEPKPRVLDLKTIGLQDRLFNGIYLGGHALFPEKKNIAIMLQREEAIIAPLGIHIPYSSIKEVNSVAKEKVDWLKVWAFGIAGALDKTSHPLLCITFNDGTQDQKPVIDLPDIEDAQWEVYSRFMKAHAEKKNTQTIIFPS